jgi:threonylcarbamoyladenosine tRNA methylthiotransferase MtaB
MGDRTRSFLKVQDGCDYKCTFCTIPQARGRSRSATVDSIVRQAKEIGNSGIKEIVLTGVNIGDFGNGTSVIEDAHPKKESLFIDLIRALDEVEEISRFRISSIEPNLCTDEIIEFVSESRRFMPHFHMPLQSGSNEILAKMRRRYQKELYQNRVNHIRSLMPHACIGVDVISGFPGETDQHFHATYHFLDSLDISYIHAFTYSERDQTPAASMPDVIPVQVRRERSQVMRELSSRKKLIHFSNHLGETRDVLLEPGHYDTLHGFTDNYIRIMAKAPRNLVNAICPVKLSRLTTEANELFVEVTV